jgi:hypothetical protein
MTWSPTKGIYEKTLDTLYNSNDSAHDHLAYDLDYYDIIR